jgi:hypothetical protein
MGGFFRKRFHPFELRLESGREIVRPVLEKHDEAKGEKNKENEPEKPANQRHAIDGNLLARGGQRG